MKSARNVVQNRARCLSRPDCGLPYREGAPEGIPNPAPGIAASERTRWVLGTGLLYLFLFVACKRETNRFGMRLVIIVYEGAWNCVVLSWGKKG